MRVVIAYDISADDDRARVAAILSGWGDRIQRSVFACTVDPTELAELMHRIQTNINPRTDAVHVLRQCEPCHGAMHILGQAEGFDRPLYWVV